MICFAKKLNKQKAYDFSSKVQKSNDATDKIYEILQTIELSWMISDFENLLANFQDLLSSIESNNTYNVNEFYQFDIFNILLENVYSSNELLKYYSFMLIKRIFETVDDRSLNISSFIGKIEKENDVVSSIMVIECLIILLERNVYSFFEIDFVLLMNIFDNANIKGKKTIINFIIKMNLQDNDLKLQLFNIIYPKISNDWYYILLIFYIQKYPEIYVFDDKEDFQQIVINHLSSKDEWIVCSSYLLLSTTKNIIPKFNENILLSHLFGQNQNVLESCLFCLSNFTSNKNIGKFCIENNISNYIFSNIHNFSFQAKRESLRFLVSLISNGYLSLFKIPDNILELFLSISESCDSNLKKMISYFIFENK